VVDALAAEDRERRRLADALHDEAIQNLMAARQELASALEGDETSAETVEIGLDRTIRQLRDAVFQLHPYVLEHAGLEAALRAVADEQGRRGGFSWSLQVQEEAATGQEALLLSVARELLVNAAKHAQATHVSVAVRREGPSVLLTVSDDGRGVDLERIHAAPQEGHIGLASLAERVEAAGGTFTVHGAPQAGTTVRAALPARATRTARPGRPTVAVD
jgi:two-component system NarL family sensor kinase